MYVAVSATTLAQAREARDADAAKLREIPNGIRLDRYTPDPIARAQLRAELGLGDAWVVGTVGRMDANKNQAMLVRALAPSLSAQRRLVIVGDGDARADVEAAAAGSPFVTFTGRRMDVPRLVHAFDVFALSSISEGLPLVVPEAMAAALPIVSTAVGGIPDVVQDGVTGLLVPVDERALGDALNALANDLARARAMGKAARELALARYSAERMVDAYLALYASAIKRDRNG